MRKHIAFGMALALASNGLAPRTDAFGPCPSPANLVTVNVAVTDHDGNAIEGLKRTDFSVTEDGRKQQIILFAFQGQDLDSTPPAIAPNPFRSLNHRLITFLFDFTLTSRNERARIEDEATDFIRNGLKPGEFVSIETVTAGLVETAQDFTDDRAALAAAVHKAGDNAADIPPSEFEIFNADGMLSRIATVCRVLPVAGKKSLLYFPPAIERPVGDNSAVVEAAVGACMKSNVAIYPVGAASAGIAALANGTGGQTFPGLRPAIDDARRESEGYYVVGYYSTNSRHDGAYRNVELKLTRPDLQQARLQYSHGYFADMEFGKFTDAYRQDYFNMILGLGQPVVRLPLAVEIDYFRIAPDSFLVPVSVKLPGTPAAMARERGYASVHIDFGGQITTGERPDPWILNDSIELPLAGPTMAELSSTPITRTMQASLPAGEHRLNFLTRVRETGDIGTYRADFAIPDLAAETADVRMSSMVLGTGWRPATQSAGWEPMVVNGSELVPSVTHVFGKNQSVYVYAEAYDAVPGPGGQPNVTATVALLSGRDVAFESRPVTLDHFLAERHRTLALSVEAPLASLPAGPYSVRLSLVDENGHKSGSREVGIMVLSGAPATPAPLDSRPCYQ